MKSLYDIASYKSSKVFTKEYSTSFSIAVKMLSPKIQKEIYAIYGFVRVADEIVDSFEGYRQSEMLSRFESDYYQALEQKISVNPILNAFQATVHRYNIEDELVSAFLDSMKMDLNKIDFTSQEEYNRYIYGSADVVGLMCLRVFVDGNNAQYENLKLSAMKLGSAFQKVNFLRDLKDDSQRLERSYFPHVDFNALNDSSKSKIIEEIEEDFRIGFEGLKKLPLEARFGVYTAYRYYLRLLKKLKKTKAESILNTRIRVSDPMKFILLTKSYIRCQLNILAH